MAGAAPVVRPRRLRPFPFPGAGARMAAGTSPAAGPRSRAAMAQWRKKKGLRKRRGAAPQARSSDSEDGEFEIQAEDDTRAQKVSAGLGHTLEPEPRLRAAPRGLRFPSWGVGTAEGGERSAGQESGRFAGLSACLGPVKPRVLAAGATRSRGWGLRAFLAGFCSRPSLAISYTGAGPSSVSSNEKCGF